MTAYDPLHPDLGQHAWHHEEGGFFHGYINGVYSRMVCTPEEFEEVREKESLFWLNQKEPSVTLVIQIM